MKKLFITLFSIGLLPIASIQALQWDSENVVDSDTLLLYHFNEGTGTTIVDSSGNDFDGTLASADAWGGSAPTWLTTPSGDYLAPVGGNGMNANVTVNGANFNNGLTVSFWYRAEVGETQGGTLFGLGVNNIRIATDNAGTGTGGRLRLRNNANGELVDFGGEGTWRHIGVVYDPLNSDASDGGQWRFYLNNSLVDTLAESTDLGSLTSFTVRIGDNVGGTSTLTGGNIDEFLISNRMITDFSTAVIPEPSTLILIGLAGLAGLAVLRKRS